jgi:hypothetical protein
MTITSEVEPISQPNHGISHGPYLYDWCEKMPVSNSLRRFVAVRSLRCMWRESYCVVPENRILAAILSPIIRTKS